MFNLWAPPILNGFNLNGPDSPCIDDDGGYMWPANGGFQTLTAGQRLNGETITLDFMSDFVWMGFHWSFQSQATSSSGFLIRVMDDEGNYISPGLMHCFNMSGTQAVPFPIHPYIHFKSGQEIKFDIQNADLTFSQGFQLVFRGPKRYSKR